MDIVVLAGGTSTERDVSLVSGTMVCKALRENGHRAILLDVYLGIETDNIDDIFDRGEELLNKVACIKAENPDIEAVKALRPDGDKCFFGPHIIEICQRADAVFMALHGENGENGKVQAAFDLMGIKYTGTDYLSSAIAMDKVLAKELFVQHNIPTPVGFSIKKGEPDNHEVPFPVVVKVSTGGSSVGVYIANNTSEYNEAKENAFQFGDELVVEQYIKGREFSCGVIEGEALPVIEIAPVEGFYDYKNKYQAGSTIETCPAVLTDEQTKRMQQIAVDVFNCLRLKKYSRIDIMMNEAGEMFALEANTLPGMTPTSLMPQEAAAIGMNFNQLCEKLIALALV